MGLQCKHENGEFVQLYSAGYSYPVINGVVAQEAPQLKVGPFMGYRFTCSRCGRTWCFGSRGAIYNKWLQELVKQAALLQHKRRLI